MFAFSAGRNSLSVNGARGVFLLFAALIGLSMSSIFLVYTHASIARVFFETAAAFGALSLYGYTTQQPVGDGFVHGDGPVRPHHRQRRQHLPAELRPAVGAVGRRHRDLRRPDRLGHPGDQGSYYAGDGREASEKKAIYGALQLYLDFINMFQFLLTLFGDRRN